MLIDHFDLDGDPALGRLAAIVHAADIDAELHTDPLGPGLLAIGLGGLDVEADDHRLLERASFVYDALYAWSAQQVATAAGMTGHLDYDALRADTVRQVAKLMAAVGDHRPQVRRAAVPAGQAPVHRDRHRRRPRHPAAAGRLVAGPGQGTPRGDLVP